jgi:hypothetical protein
MRELQFIHNEGAINLLIANRVEEILPMLGEAARAVSEAEKEMKFAPADRM